MGFLVRRREAKFHEEANEMGNISDDLVALPLDDPLAQDLRLAVEQRLDQEWQMPPFWSQVGFDFTNMRGRRG